MAADTKRVRTITNLSALASLIAIGVLACGAANDPKPKNDETGSQVPTSDPTTPTDQTPSASSTTPVPTTTATTPTPPLKTATDCFKAKAGPITGPNYDQFNPKILPDCSGTHHQTITGVERVVFLGDSVTAGTPPTPIKEFYRSRLEDILKQKFGNNVQFSSCAGWGSRVNDLLDNDKQINTCFPSGVEQKKTLIVMTNGGNDISQWAKSKLSAADAMAEADQTLAQLKTAIEWLKSPVHFPNGSYVVFANVYEYTDTSGDLSSCPAAALSGFTGAYSQGAPAVVHLEEGYMKVAVETQTDLLFLLEHFCGHGYKRNDPSLQCYLGPNTPLWFDMTCYHPNPAGHEQIALEFAKVIDGI